MSLVAGSHGGGAHHSRCAPFPYTLRHEPREQVATMRIVNPLAGVVTSGFDRNRIHPTLKRVVPHLGTDIGGRPRDGRAHTIHAPMDGAVIWSRGNWPHGRGYLARLTGNGVVIEHQPANGRTVRSYHGHLSRVDVVAGDVVRAGDVIGTQGATGDVSGAHLHLEVWVAGVPVDPALFFASRGVLLGTGPTQTDFDVESLTIPEEEMLKAIEFSSKGVDGHDHLYVAFPNAREYDYIESDSEKGDYANVLARQGFVYEKWQNASGTQNVGNPDVFGKYVGPESVRPVNAKRG